MDSREVFRHDLGDWKRVGFFDDVLSFMVLRGGHGAFFDYAIPRTALLAAAHPFRMLLPTLLAQVSKLVLIAHNTLFSSWAQGVKAH